VVSVIIGIIVTFGGSAMIQRCTEHKEATKVLSMVRDELEKNLDFVATKRRILIHEKAGAVAMKPYMHTPKSMPSDSLDKYLDILSRSKYFVLLTNSFEVLKSSQQIKNINDKELLRDLFTTYADMAHFQNNIASYNSLKDSGVDEYYSYLDSDTYDTLLREVDRVDELYIVFGDMVAGSPMLRKFIVSTASGGGDYLVPRADSLMAEMEYVIGLIDKDSKR
jgi:hypothetical protein